MKKYLFTLLFGLLPFLSFSQSSPEYITDSNFKKKINTGMVVVEFIASFGTPFEDWEKLESCDYYRIDISQNPEMMAKYDIQVVPTVIVFDSGEDIETFKAGIMFTLENTAEDIQEIIDEVLDSRF